MSDFFRQNRVGEWLKQIATETLSYEDVFVEDVISRDDIPKYYDAIIADYEKLLQDLTDAMIDIGKKTLS